MNTERQPSEKPLDYEDCYVAYLDLLGYSQWVARANTKNEAGDAIRILQQALRSFVPPASEREDQGALMETFASSDSIALRSRPLGDNRFGFRHVWEIANICYGLTVKTGLLVRGAATWGKYYRDEYVLFSPAFIAAVELERAEWRPRVLVVDAIAQGSARWPPIGAQGASCPLILADSEGRSYVNYLAVHLRHRDIDAETADAWLTKHRDLTVAGLGTWCARSSVGRKYAWLREYHNLYCSSYLPDDLARRMIVP
ncbi:MAG: hypothetical protein KKI08_06440 [Armatimonadetes bacterium]|nr:hypothetical protein [Armatimonadota bacterium]